MEPLTRFPFLINSFIEGSISVERYEKYIFDGSQSVPTESNETTPLMLKLSEDETCGSIGSDENFVVARKAIFSWMKRDLEVELPIKCLPSQDFMALERSGSGLITSQLSNAFENSTSFTQTRRRNVAAAFRIEIPFLDLKAGECVAVVGSPASGKSSLLLALLGEMPQISGDLKVVRSTGNEIIERDRSVGYISQIPWIPGGTIRSAILFGRPYVKERYEKVISVCELQQASPIRHYSALHRSIRISMVGLKAMGALSSREHPT